MGSTESTYNFKPLGTLRSRNVITFPTKGKPWFSYGVLITLEIKVVKVLKDYFDKTFLYRVV